MIDDGHSVRYDMLQNLYRILSPYPCPFVSNSNAHTRMSLLCIGYRMMFSK